MTLCSTSQIINGSQISGSVALEIIRAANCFLSFRNNFVFRSIGSVPLTECFRLVSYIQLLFCACLKCPSWSSRNSRLTRKPNANLVLSLVLSLLLDRFQDISESHSGQIKSHSPQHRLHMVTPQSQLFASVAGVFILHTRHQ